MQITLTELEQAINFWRGRKPSTGEESALCAEAGALAAPYAAMIMNHWRELDEAALSAEARAAIAAWRAAADARPG